MRTTDIMMTTATAVTKPRNSARLRTTSRNPSLNRPRRKLIKPTCSAVEYRAATQRQYIRYLERDDSRDRKGYCVGVYGMRVWVGMEDLVDCLANEQGEGGFRGDVQLSRCAQ